jgi:hypothetical protein
VQTPRSANTLSFSTDDEALVAQGDAIVDLGTIHSQDALVVEHQPIEPEDAADRDRVCVLHPRAAIDVHLHVKGLCQWRRLPGLRGKNCEQIVIRQLYRIDRELAADAGA